MCMSGFSLLEDCGPPQYPKNSIISPTWRIPHHNLITHPVFSITKESNCQDNSSSNFPPTPSKTLPQEKFPIPLKCPVSQLLLTLFGWLHVNEYILQFNKLQTPQQKSCGSSIKVVLLYLLSKV